MYVFFNVLVCCYTNQDSLLTDVSIFKVSINVLYVAV